MIIFTHFIRLVNSSGVVQDCTGFFHQEQVIHLSGIGRFGDLRSFKGKAINALEYFTSLDDELSIETCVCRIDVDALKFQKS